MQSISVLRNNVKLSTLDIEQLPNHHKKSSKEWSSACPLCGGEDRFLFWPGDGNYWCRQCELSGWVDQETQSKLTEDEIADIERRKREARQAEIERTQSALRRLQSARLDVIYHQQLNGKSQEVSRRWGLTPDSIELFKVGYCTACPTSTYSDSFTIPYYWSGKLINLRHRLMKPNGNGKYRPEMAGLPTAIYNADIIKDEEWLVLVEGEFKAMVLSQVGLPAIGIPGATIFKDKWLALFAKGQRVYVALDPGAEDQGRKIGSKFSGSGIVTRLVSLPVKPDDFFVLYGGNLAQFCSYLDNGRAI